MARIMIQKVLDILECWAKSNNVKLNKDESKVLHWV